MDEKIARYLLRASHAYVGPMTVCLSLSKDKLEEERHKLIGIIIGNIVADVYSNVINKILDMYPSLVKEMQEDDERYQRYIL